MREGQVFCENTVLTPKGNDAFHVLLPELLPEIRQSLQSTLVILMQEYEFSLDVGEAAAASSDDDQMEE